MSEKDQELIQRASKGEREAFGELVVRHQDRVFNLAYRLTGRHHEAMDLCQEAFVRAFAAISNFRAESAFFTWVYRIVLNLHMNREKSLGGRAAKKMFSLDCPARSTDKPIEMMDQTAADPSLPIEDRERDEIIQEAIMKLEADHRQVVLLRDMEGMSYGEITAYLEIPEGTVKSRLHRARDELRALLKRIL